jgi:flagellar hook-basal body complex protein FliE
MPAPLSAIGGGASLPEPARLAGEIRKPGAFQAALEGAMQAVEGLRGEAVEAVQKFLSGESEELHTAALATQRAELAFELGLQVRNKVVQAYQEIMRMPM